MLLLNDFQIKQKIRRLAIQILERNYNEPAIVLAGINTSGSALASLLRQELQSLTSQRIQQVKVKLNPANPLASPIEVDVDPGTLANEVIILVDDVANTGRTTFYACKPFLDVLPNKMEIAVLVDRMHKAFPMHPDYVGLSLATTLQDNIVVQLGTPGEYSVTLS